MRLWSVLTMLLIGLPAAAQLDNSLDLRVESSAQAGSGENAPFWLTSNRQGLYGISNGSALMRCAVLGKHKVYGDWSTEYGVDAVMAHGMQSTLWLHELYLDIKWRSIGLEAGMKERWGDKNIQLSSGSLTWSGNARPVPQVQLGIPDYTRLGILGGWFSIRGMVGYGKLTDSKWRSTRGTQNYTEGILFHSKEAFLRIGNLERAPLQFTIGLEMDNLFGGARHLGNQTVKLPQDAGAYWKALFPFHEVEKQGSTDGDNYGSWHLNLDYMLSDWRVGAYYEHFYEDHSSMLGVEYKNNTEAQKGFIFFGFKRNWLNGLYGIEVNAPDDFPYFQTIVLEYMNSRDQCGPVRHSACDNYDGMYVVEEIDGRDGMYNHGVNDADTHWGYAMGNPVLISPVYNKDGYQSFRSDRVRMFHAGISGNVTSRTGYRILATTTRHWGQYRMPFKKVEQVSSILLECSHTWGTRNPWKVTLSGAMDFDTGDLLGNNKGVMLTVLKKFRLYEK